MPHILHSDNLENIQFPTNIASSVRPNNVKQLNILSTVLTKTIRSEFVIIHNNEQIMRTPFLEKAIEKYNSL